MKIIQKILWLFYYGYFKLIVGMKLPKYNIQKMFSRLIYFCYENHYSQQIEFLHLRLSIDHTKVLECLAFGLANLKLLHCCYSCVYAVFCSEFRLTIFK